MPEGTQHEAWESGGAADAYFKRNQAALDAEQAPSRAVRFFATHVTASDRLLEAGAANGRVAEQLRQLTGCEAHATDPSPAAVADGRARYPKVRLSVGTADKIEYPDAAFTVVLFGFCLYLVDRSRLLRVVTEADRVLAEGGKLMITDFDPPAPHRRAFRHQPGLWSYKMQYPALWLANPAYVLAEKIAFSHQGETFHADPGERVASWVLVKRGVDGFPEHAR